MEETEKTKHVWEATGLLSGDHEAFCLDVTAEEFERVMGHPPQYSEYRERYVDQSFFNEGLFRLYPEFLPGYASTHFPCKVRIEVTPLLPEDT
jgi:hypothetical protein